MYGSYEGGLLRFAAQVTIALNDHLSDVEIYTERILCEQ